MENKLKKINKASKLISDYVSYSFLDINDNNETKYKINDIALLLKPNQWLRVENKKFNPKLNFYQHSESDIKPNGIWASKGEWIFHSRKDRLITLMEVDYSKILVLTTKKDYIQFEKKYCILQNFGTVVNKYMDYKLSTYGNKNNKKTKKNIVIPDKYIKYKNKNICYSLIDWNKVSKDYDGIAMVPNPRNFYKVKNYNQYHPNSYEHIWLKTYDVSSLVIWNQNNSNPIISSKPLGTVQEFIKNYKKLLTHTE
jgi:hypothetical protein